MFYEESQYSELMSGKSSEQLGLHAFLATGPGEVALEVAPKNHHLLIPQQNQVPTSFFIPKDPMATQVPYIQSQPYYGQPPWAVRTLDTKRTTPTENVTVKAGSQARNRIIKYLFLIGFGMAICGIPLAVISTLYAQQRASSSTTTNTTSNDSVANVTLPRQCSNYTVNNDSTRNVGYGAGALCDNTLTTGWYRFIGGAGTTLTTTYVSRDTCSTYYGGSYNGTLPLTAGTTTYGILCLNNNGYLCYAPWSGSLIGITNCNGYYVYYLTPILRCNARYCTTT